MAIVPRITLNALDMFGLAAVVVVCLATGCSKSGDSTDTATKPKYEVADENEGTETPSTAGDVMTGEASTNSTGASGAPPTQPPPVSIDQLEAITVPAGTPTELLAFANAQGDKIMTIQAETGGRVQGEAKTRVIELFRAIVLASDKLLTANNATLDERRGAIENKAGAMSWLSQLEPETDWASKVRGFAVTLISDTDPQISLRGKEILFGIQLGDFARGRSQDVEGMMEQLKALLQEQERGEVVMSVAIQAMNSLVSLGYESQAREVLDLIVAAFQKSQDPNLAAEANRLVEQALFMDSEIEPKFNAVMSHRPGAADIFLSELTKILAKPSAGSMAVDKGARYIGIMQQAGQYEVARKLCEMYQERFANCPDEALKQHTERLTQMALRRINLIGKPLVVKANRLDGVSLDFSHYQQKVVLVVFFAAFDSGCQQELMTIKTVYQKYHDQGFDVVGVSVDPKLDVLNQFLDQAQLPWLTVTNNQMAEQCGADMLPFGVLLDRKGMVTDIFVQGPALTGKLAALLGPSPSAPPASSPPAGKGPAAGPAKSAGDQSRHVPLRTMRPSGHGFVSFGQPVERSEASSAVQTSAATASGEGGEQEGDDDEIKLDEDEEAVNPYLAREGLSPAQLVYFLFDMQDKPKSVRRRPGFTDAMVDAADRILQSKAKDNQLLIAAQTKLEILHESACLGDTKADEQLATYVRELADDQRSEIISQTEFFRLERRALTADQIELTDIPSLLGELKQYFEGQAVPGKQHLRIASATVHAINRLESDAEREKYFTQFGNLFAKSDDRQLAHYGKKLAQGGKGQASDLVGQQLELEGMTDLGVPLDWDSYRGKVVLVDFWATWCGPCLQEIPHVQALYEKLSGAGFDVVAVSLDEDMEALVKFLADKKVPWTNVIGEEARALATKYQVRGIPTMMLVDKNGKVAAVSHKVETVRPHIKQLLPAE